MAVVEVRGDGRCPALAGVLLDRQPRGCRGPGTEGASTRPPTPQLPRAAVEAQIEAESLPMMFLSGRLYDDGVIDPRDTCTVLGM